MVLLIDNYDSFSYNLYQYVGSVTEDIKVIRNDEMGLDEIRALAPSHIILSPGPGAPRDAGICESVALGISNEVPTLGVCLGHQAICEAYGATVGYARQLMHGKQSMVKIDTSSPIFNDMESEIKAGRYHSLAAEPDTLPSCLKVIGRSQDGEVMAVSHEEYPIYGVQFHPESILTPCGLKIIENFLSL